MTDKLDELRQRMQAGVAAIEDAVRNGEISQAEGQAEIEICTAMCKLLEMQVEKWPPGGAMPSDMARAEGVLEMWPEACRRAGVPAHPAPRELFNKSVGQA